MKSNWEEAKLKSTYHFNKWHTDTDVVQHLGRFTGGWQTELQTVIDDAKPLNWGNRRIGSGRPDGDVEAEENDLINTLEKRPSSMDVILTGPSIPSQVMEMADQITELRCGG